MSCTWNTQSPLHIHLHRHWLLCQGCTCGFSFVKAVPATSGVGTCMSWLDLQASRLAQGQNLLQSGLAWDITICLLERMTGRHNTSPAGWYHHLCCKCRAAVVRASSKGGMDKARMMGRKPVPRFGPGRECIAQVSTIYMHSTHHGL